MSWIEVRAELPETSDLSPFVEIFREHGIENTLEEGNSLTGAIANVEAAERQIAFLREALVEAGALSVSTQDLPETNWEEAWKQFFKPRRVGRHFVIRPSWEEFAFGPDDIEIVLDPGQAFGTGDHPTTRLCLQLLEDANLRDARVADIGCGSGILSVAACKLRAAEVLAIDIEPVSVEVARHNADMNGVRFLAMVGEGITPVMDPSLGRTDGAPPLPKDAGFDVVVSNIISAILIRLARDVFLATIDGGRWIVSGIIVQNWPDVQAAAESAGFTLEKRLEEDGWVAAMFAK
ncbi:MAG TPA: 50S ribosomal protein L11 methyltransferase [Fimbriimonas sp.]|nr:50S ribosomal protein L11 methyltransferase [Fimbriimonas sp.]